MNVTAPMVGKLVSLSVEVGGRVRKNDVVATVESMKMYVRIYAPADGAVKEIKAAPGDLVNPESVLMVLE